MKRQKKIWFLLILSICSVVIKAQEETCILMFYNVENFFDCEDDTLKMDEEFLPKGKKFWTKSKMFKKKDRIYKTILSVGKWTPPSLVALAEVENENVLNLLIKTTGLSNLDYRYIHRESPDRRGIDLALLYRTSDYKPVKTSFYELNFPFSPDLKTRLLLYSKGVLKNKDTLHVFVNHWPSRYGGKEVSAPKRNFVAAFLRSKIDSILTIDAESKLIVCGDFNDEPEDESVQVHLNAQKFSNITNNSCIFNLSTFDKDGFGTHKYNGRWSLLDQIIVSRALLTGTKGYILKPDAYTIFREPFLLEPDLRFLGYKPKRTYNGFKYNDGYSDHLPVYVELILQD